MTLASIGIGSNLGDPQREVQAAIAWLARSYSLVKHSSMYRSAPLGFLEQPDFMNAVALIKTDIAPKKLLLEMLAYEKARGRQRSFTNAPRPVDLDLLLYGEMIIKEPDLIVPHPRMHERAFVLAPLLEIMPNALIPGKGMVRFFLDAVSPCQRLERLTHEPFDSH
jgi:2-amino-4-hydroxy-6-hydroxymethyldihydropteridine diphosphokinase